MKNNSLKNLKKYTFILAVLLINLYIAYSAISYNRFISSYRGLIQSQDYSKAKALEDSKLKANVFKVLLLNRDKNLIVNEHIDNLAAHYNSNNLKEQQLIASLEAARSLEAAKDKIDELKATLPSIKVHEDSYNSALKLIKEGNFEKALEAINNIPSYAPIYTKAQAEKETALKNYKEQTFKNARELADKDYYTKAIGLLEESKKYLLEDTSINEEIEKYKAMRTEYLVNNSTTISTTAKEILLLDDIALEASSSLSLEDKINSLSLESSSPYIAWVSTAKQITYVFHGSKNQWKLIKEFPCSTGKSGHDTPLGVFSTNGDKDTWFFNDKYDDGAKYWTRINGVYLFHSIPFAIDQVTVKDPILGEPRSHGCVRLEVEDAKWIYDNLSKGTTVVVR